MGRPPDWLLPVAHALKLHGGRICASELAEWLGVPTSTARKLLWALVAWRLAVRESASCVRESQVLADWKPPQCYSLRRGLVYVAYSRGVLYYVKLGDTLRAYNVPLHLACTILGVACSRGAVTPELGDDIGVHRKTVSLAIRALKVLGCLTSSGECRPCCLEQHCKERKH